MKVILASQNQHKLVELSAILSQLDFEIALESEYGLHVDVDETGTNNFTGSIDDVIRSIQKTCRDILCNGIYFTVFD